MGESLISQYLTPIWDQRWGAFRIALALSSVCISLVLVVGRLTGSSSICGGGCRTAQAEWYSPVFLAGLIIGSVFALVSQFTWSDVVRRRIAGLLAVAAIYACIVMVRKGDFCAMCIGAQTLCLALALEATGLVGFRILAIGCSLLGLDAAYEVWNLTGRPLASPVAFSKREGESFAKASPFAFVVFTDPYCPFCRRDERSLADANLPIPILFRWDIVPQHGVEPVRLAAALESAMRADPGRASKLLKLTFSLPAPPNEAAFVAFGVTAGFGPAQLKSWVEQPEARSLSDIAADGKLAEKLGLHQVPALCAVEDGGAGTGPSIRAIRRQDIDAYSAMESFDLSPLKVFVP